MTTRAPSRTRTRPAARRAPKPPRPKRARPTPAPKRTAAGPAIDPRLRDRRVEIKRAEGRRRLHRVVAVLVLLGLASGAVAAVFSPLLDVDQVRIVGPGLSPERRAAVQAAAAVDAGSPLLFVDTGGVEARVEDLGWVADARVARHFPGTLTVSVRPRLPVAWAGAADGSIRLVDPSGRVVATSPTAPEGLPELLGADPAAAARVAPDAAAVAGAIPARFRPLVAAVVVADGQAALRLTTGTEVRLGAPVEVTAKVEAADAVLRTLVFRAPIYVDVRVPSAPVTG